MEFRPCIDIHNGKVKQIVGSSLKDQGNQAVDNFVSSQDASFYANLYKKDDLSGGHVILLNSRDSEFYQDTKAQAMLALSTYPGGLMVGGGIQADNAKEFLDAGASHVIVTSYVFRDGKILYDRIHQMNQAIGPGHLTLDLSCRMRQGKYYVVTDRWQRFTEEELTLELLERLSPFCSEFLIHAVDVEGKSAGIDQELVSYLGRFDLRPLTYAGGIHSYEDLDKIQQFGKDHVHATVGSALDLFGGPLSYDLLAKKYSKLQ